MPPGSTRRKFKPGAKVLVLWNDIHTDPIGDPKDTGVARFETVARFVRWRKGKHGWELLTSDTRDVDTGEWYGCTVYPAGCIVKVKGV